MGKGSRIRRQNGNNAASALVPCNGKDEKKIFESTRDKEKDDQNSQPCKRCEDEISKLRELNQILVKNIDTSRQEEFRKLDSLDSERELLSQKNRALSTEVESLKAQLNEYNARLVQVEGERLQNEKVLQRCRTENIDLQSNLHDSNGRIEDLQRKIEDATHLWNAEKSNLESTVTELQTQHELKGSEMGSLTKENRALKSELNDSKKRNHELLQNIEDDRQSCDVKKSNLEGSLAATCPIHSLHSVSVFRVSYKYMSLLNW